MKKIEKANDIPQGLKPSHSCAGYGTAEAVPLQDSRLQITVVRELMA
jgi:hypothetical protein